MDFNTIFYGFQHNKNSMDFNTQHHLFIKNVSFTNINLRLTWGSADWGLSI